MKPILSPVANTRRKLLRLLGLGLVGVVIHKFVPFRLPDAVGKAMSPLRHFQFREQSGKLVFYNAIGRRLFTLSDDGELEIG